ncbi:hypothetical protein RISK_006387 [Rhodopirellula islandica]|uniref:Uncharacterized protein n=1 Tax=Rhodopirellula islandica TaxID=595434 RepID=A0A0J1B3X3_RHOIS|nr:hypothetical protein RISK_006387 [Rhodopirellula islandica]
MDLIGLSILKIGCDQPSGDRDGFLEEPESPLFRTSDHSWLDCLSRIRATGVRFQAGSRSSKLEKSLGLGLTRARMEA